MRSLILIATLIPVANVFLSLAACVFPGLRGPAGWRAVIGENLVYLRLGLKEVEKLANNAADCPQALEAMSLLESARQTLDDGQSSSLPELRLAQLKALNKRITEAMLNVNRARRLVAPAIDDETDH